MKNANTRLELGEPIGAYAEGASNAELALIRALTMTLAQVTNLSISDISAMVLTVVSLQPLISRADIKHWRKHIQDVGISDATVAIATAYRVQLERNGSDGNS